MTFPPTITTHWTKNRRARTTSWPKCSDGSHSDGSVSRDAFIYSGRLFQINGQANGESAVSRVYNVSRQLVHAF